jgi:hypothetical protein
MAVNKVAIFLLVSSSALFIFSDALNVDRVGRNFNDDAREKSQDAFQLSEVVIANALFGVHYVKK